MGGIMGEVAEGVDKMAKKLLPDTDKQQGLPSSFEAPLRYAPQDEGNGGAGASGGLVGPMQDL